MNDRHWFSHLRVEKHTLRSFKQRVVLGLAILLAVPTPWAHHSFATYDQKTTLMLSGTLKRFDWGIRRIDYGNPKLEIITTVHDAEYYSAPWSMVRTFAWRPDMASFQEYNCEWQAGAPDKVEYGLATEPANE